MTWLVKLYPPRWRRRYGRELAALIAEQPLSIGATVDLLGGAVDAWLNPGLAAARSDMKGGLTMVGRLMQLKCAGYGPTVTKADRARNLAVNLVGTLALALAWLGLVWATKHRRSAWQPYVMSLAPMAYLIPYMAGQHYTSLKGRSAGAQVVLIAGVTALLAAFLLLIGWITTKI